MKFSLACKKVYAKSVLFKDTIDWMMLWDENLTFVENAKNALPNHNLHAARGLANRYKLKFKSMSSLCKLADKNPMWKGALIGKGDAIHLWVKSRINKPKRCVDCNKVKRLDLANISQEYKRDLDDWEWLCRKCHMLKDGRLAKLISRHIPLENRECVECKKSYKPTHKRRIACSRKCSAIYIWRLKKKLIK